MPALPARYATVGAPISGGMGSVQAATDTILQRQVAIKFLHATTHKRRIEDEIDALLKMRSKHVVQVYDILRFPGDEIGIVQEFIDGPDLLRPFVAPRDRADYYKRIWQIASGIADIHELGVIHRDIKPNNMKTDPEGLIKIFDFGFARDEGPAASTLGFVGTRGFGAPELFGSRVAFTTAVDTFAFGITAYFVATGGIPADLLRMPPLAAPAGLFAALPLALSQDVSDALQACLALAPDQRPAMREVQRLLARHLLHDRHQALLVFNGNVSQLSAANRTVDLNLPTVGQIRIAYDGLDFIVESVSGEVLINNREPAVGEVIPGSCVVALGGTQRYASRRSFITFDVSHPEIVL